MEENSASLLTTLKQDYGITLEEIAPAKLQTQEFQKLSSDKAASFLQVLQYVPGFLSNKAIQDTYAGAYRLIIPNNLPVGVEMMPRSGLGKNLVGTIFRDSTTKQFVAQGGLEKINETAAMAPQIAYAVFSVASIATGQYFMAQINGKLSVIEKTSTNILRFLELDKRSELQAQQIYISEVYQNIDAIISCAPHRQATIVSIQSIRSNALSAILFYQQQLHTRIHLDDVVEGADKKPKKKQIEELSNDVATDISHYWLSLSLYCSAAILEFLLAQNTNQLYLQFVKQDLIKQCNTYKECYNSCKTKILDYIQQIAPKEKIYLVGKIVVGGHAFA